MICRCMDKMLSYKSYLILIFLPYLFLILIFHTQLQLYDGTAQSHNVVALGGKSDLNADHSFHFRDLMLKSLSGVSDHRLLKNDFVHGEVGRMKLLVEQKSAARNAGAVIHDHIVHNTDPKLHKALMDLKPGVFQGRPHLPSNLNAEELLESLRNDSLVPEGILAEPLLPPGVLGTGSVQQDIHQFPSLSHCPLDKGTRRAGVQFQSLLKNYVYTAYYDDRLPGPALVHIIALLKRRDKPSFYCHFEDPEGEAVNGSRPYLTSTVGFYEMCENHAKDYGGWILSCPVPGLNTRPPCHVVLSVHSVYDKKSSGHVRVPVFRTRELWTKKQDFAVCIPPLFGHVPSMTLVEFIEMTKLFGANHFFFYQHQVPREIHKVLSYYQNLGVVSVIPWELPLKDRMIWYHGQLLAVNDCLYRSMHGFKYVAFNDIDEFIVPHKHANWTEMIGQIELASSGIPLDEKPVNLNNLEYKFTNTCGYSYKSAFFDPLMSTSSRVLYDLESDLRTKIFSKVRAKVMVNPEKIYELGIHHISKPNDERDRIVYVGPNMAFIHHYRKCMTDFDPKMNCQIFARDESLSPFIPTLRHNVHQTLWVLKEMEKHISKSTFHSLS